MTRLSRPQSAAVRSDVKAALSPVLASARANIHSRTGTLAGSLRIRTGGDRPGRYSAYIAASMARGRFVRRRHRTRREGQKIMALGSARDRYRVWYARPLERGHVLVSHGRTVGTVAPRPFAAPAFDAHVQAMGDALVEQLWSRLETEW